MNATSMEKVRCTCGHLPYDHTGTSAGYKGGSKQPTKTRAGNVACKKYAPIDRVAARRLSLI